VGFLIHPRVAWQVLDGEAILIDLDRGRSLGLNETGSFLWPRLAASSEEDLVSALLAEFDVTPEAARRDVNAFLQQLRERGFVQP
jgi:hypothetical protein